VFAALSAVGLAAGGTYTYDKAGQDAWPDVVVATAGDSALCGSGREQSPIDLKSATHKDAMGLSFANYLDYQNAAQKKLKWMGHTWQVDFTNGLLTKTDDQGNTSQWNPA
jgi:carbonic anhydrase